MQSLAVHLSGLMGGEIAYIKKTVTGNGAEPGGLKPERIINFRIRNSRYFKKYYVLGKFLKKSTFELNKFSQEKININQIYCGKKSNTRHLGVLP